MLSRLYFLKSGEHTEIPGTRFASGHTMLLTTPNIVVVVNNNSVDSKMVPDCSHAYMPTSSQVH